MKKLILLSTLLFALALSACQSSAATPDAVSEPTLDPLLVDTEIDPPENCTVVTQPDAPEPTGEPLIPITTEGEWVSGSESASVTIIEYTDFQCPFCATVASDLAQLVSDYPDDLKVIFRHFPLIGDPAGSLNDKSALAFQAAEAAGLQDKFWPMHDLLFERRAEWVELSPEDFNAWLITESETLELDVEKFSEDLVSEELSDLAQNAWDAGIELGLTGTPSLIINGDPYLGPISLIDLDFIVSLYAIKKLQYNECPPMTIDPLKQYFATIKTDIGDIVIKLYPDVAPIAVNSFIFLAQNDYYDNVTFHRVLEDFVAQGGDPSGTGNGTPGYLFAIEVLPTVTFDRPGLFAMANSGPTSNGSQFFITFVALPQLDGQFTIFGEVVEGMDIALKITLRDPQLPDQPDGTIILDVIIEER